jgi:nitroreductase
VCQFASFALKSDLALDSAYTHKMLRRLVSSDGELEEAMQIYRDIARGDIAAWSVAQCHIAAADMMMAAAVLGLDSCPMGGFEPEAVFDQFLQRQPVLGRLRLRAVA